jgi:hypothetical protein
MFIPVPDSDFFIQRRTLEIGEIIETRDGTSDMDLPQWLFYYLSYGIERVELLNFFNGKYVFIGHNQGVNITVLNKWAESFSAEHDFFMLAAERIERRMISTSVLYPDDEYGAFYEMMVRKAYSAVYSGAVKEGTYWIKTQVNNDIEDNFIYIFFVLITIDKITMQAIIENMMVETRAVVTPTVNQRNAINRLQQNFFYGF